MFKRFLKFFRGDEDHRSEPFEGSYLDHLLAQLQPDVDALLEQSPTHDPLLLVVVGILRLTMLNAWSTQLRTPLYDSQSPGPKRVTGELPASRTAEFGTTEELTASEIAVYANGQTPANVEADEPEDESDENAEKPSKDVETTDEEPSDVEATDEEPDSDPIDTLDGLLELDLDPDETEEAAPTERARPPAVPRTPTANRKTQEINVEEVRQASLRGRLTDTAELDRVEPTHDPTIEIEHDTLFGNQPKEDTRPRVDSEEVLQAGRVFLGLLIENDRLPIELQLNVTETTLARDLLLGYFIGNDDFEEKARKLLTLVEQKFSEGAFSQARILLQLFHTDEQTRINNDRNLFYEDMILRLGIRRRHRMSAEDARKFQSLTAAVNDPESALAVTRWLSDACRIHFHAFNRDPVQVSRWKTILDGATREGAQDNFLRYLPARRWRPLGSLTGVNFTEQIINHVSLETAREYVISQIKACYFVLRAVGDTGLEGFLDSFFDWSLSTFDVDGTVLMPRLYKRSMMDPEPMTAILRDIFDEFYAEKLLALMNDVTDAKIANAAFETLRKLAHLDLGEIAPGYYDIGAFVFDEMFGAEYPSDEFAFKIHRLT